MIGPYLIVEPELGLGVVEPWPFEFALRVGGLPLPTFAEL
jgi:hypothetical protein